MSTLISSIYFVIFPDWLRPEQTKRKCLAVEFMTQQRIERRQQRMKKTYNNTIDAQGQIFRTVITFSTPSTGISLVCARVRVMDVIAGIRTRAINMQYSRNALTHNHDTSAACYMNKETRLDFTSENENDWRARARVCNGECCYVRERGTGSQYFSEYISAYLWRTSLSNN